MPAAKPPEFRRRAIALARAGDQPIAKIAADLGIAESCLRRWLKQDDLDTGRRSDGLTSDERKELAELRRRIGRWRWRWSWRSSRGPVPTSPGRTSSQNDLPGGP